MAGNRLSHTDQPAPMPHGYGKGLPHPRIIRNVDGEANVGWDDSRNVAEPFGESDDPDSFDAPNDY